MRFKIEHSTNNEKEYQAIMDIIKHYEILEKEINSKTQASPSMEEQIKKQADLIKKEYNERGVIENKKAQSLNKNLKENVEHSSKVCCDTCKYYRLNNRTQGVCGTCYHLEKWERKPSLN